MEEIEHDELSRLHISRRESIKFGASGMALSLLPASALAAAQSESQAPKEDAMTDKTRLSS